MQSADPFEAIVTEHYQPLLRFAMRLTRAEADALDLTQHTFHILAARGHQLRDITRVRPWLYTTLHRAFLRVQRHHGRFSHRQPEEVLDQLPAVSPAVPGPEDCVQVLPALARVDATYRSAVSLRYLENRSYKEIASRLDVPVGTVRSRIARGIAQLREILSSDALRASAPLDSDVDDGALVPVTRWNQTARRDSYVRHSHQ